MKITFGTVNLTLVYEDFIISACCLIDEELKKVSTKVSAHTVCIFVNKEIGNPRFNLRR
jgi:hypothetical protein